MNPSSAPEPKDPRVQAALREFRARLRHGETIDRETFLAEHAPIAKALRPLLAAEEETAPANSPARPIDESTASWMAQAQETLVPPSAARGVPLSRGTSLAGKFGRYRIIRMLGQGAMGTVYLAEDTQLARQIALKTPHFRDDADEESLERFYREARMAAMLRNQNICPVFDVGQIDGTHYITMAFIEGRPLSAFIQPDKPQPERQILIVIRKLCLAPAEAHALGTVHRDLKPANIMIDRKGEPIIMDFGLARHVQTDKEKRLTQAGVVIGTPAYMSPEQVAGDPARIGPPTDQYSLGVVFYVLLTGDLPFRGAIFAVMGRILTEEVAPPRQFRPELDPRTEAACLKMMAKNAQARFPSVAAAAAELEKILRNPATPAPERKPATRNETGPTIGATTPNSATDPVTPFPTDPTPVPRKRNKPDSPAPKSPGSSSKTLVDGDFTAAANEMARQYLARHDYEQAIALIERVPKTRRSPSLQAILDEASNRSDELVLLICAIDEAVRRGDEPGARQSAAQLLKIKPDHARAQKIVQEFAQRGASQPGTGPVWLHFPRFDDKRTRRAAWGVPAAGLAVLGLAIWGVISYSRTGKTVAPGSHVVLAAAPATTAIAQTPDAVKPPDDAKSPENAAKSPPASQASLSRLLAPFDAAQARAARASWARFRGVLEERTNSLGMTFALVPPGTFQMGAPAPNLEASSKNDERPQHRVEITKPFFVDMHEVTQQEYERVTGRNPSSFQKTDQVANSDTRRFPVENVSWFDAVHFANELSQLENRSPYYAISNIQRYDDGSIKEATVGIAGGDGYRLLTEAQWEYACRAGTTTPFSFGSTNTGIECNVDGQAPYGTEEKGPALKRPMEVGSYGANAFGLYDMHGNVWEWCQDRYDDAYYSRLPPVAVDPTGPETGGLRVERGGCYVSNAEFSRSAARSCDAPNLRTAGIGFRLALAVDASTADKKNAPPTAKPAPPATSGDLKQFLIVSGDWHVENDELVQTSKEPHRVIMFGDENWTDYDFTVDAMRMGPGDSFTLFFRRPDRPRPKTQLAFNVAGYGDRKVFVEIATDGHVEVIQKQNFHLAEHRWYTARVKARGGHFECFINDGDKEQRLIDFDDDHHPRGCVGLRTWTSSYRFRNIKVTAPDGRVLWQGLPAIGQ